jgi:hypothetical protein
MYGRPNIGDGLIREMQIVVSFLGGRGDSSGARPTARLLEVAMAGRNLESDRALAAL